MKTEKGGPKSEDKTNIIYYYKMNYKIIETL